MDRIHQKIDEEKRKKSLQRKKQEEEKQEEILKKKKKTIIQGKGKVEKEKGKNKNAAIINKKSGDPQKRPVPAATAAPTTASTDLGDLEQELDNENERCPICLGGLPTSGWPSFSACAVPLGDSDFSCFLTSCGHFYHRKCLENYEAFISKIGLANGGAAGGSGGSGVTRCSICRSGYQKMGIRTVLEGEKQSSTSPKPAIEEEDEEDDEEYG